MKKKLKILEFHKAILFQLCNINIIYVSWMQLLYFNKTHLFLLNSCLLVVYT